MPLIFERGTTPSRRHLIKLNQKHLSKKPFIKKELSGFKYKSGRNHSGKITVRNKSRGHKKKYRNIDFSRKNKSTGIIISIEYDPNRNSNIASVYDFIENNFFYILAPKKLKPGNIVESGINAKFNTGNSLPLSKIPEGSFIHNIATKTNKKSQLTRSAGTSSILKEKTLKTAKVTISSKLDKLIPINCYATIGSLDNESYFLTQLGKAGQSRWLGKRPKVRGVAMNPVDHPNGGGEGKKSGKKLSAWGKFNKTLKK